LVELVGLEKSISILEAEKEIFRKEGKLKPSQLIG
jgi:hypothetical protein